MQHQEELKARRAAWETQKKAEAEERARQEAQGRMQAFLTAKRQAWVDHAGSLPPEEVTTAWRMEFLSERQAEADAERAFRLAEAANNSPL
jgi:hypothetical protein